MKTTATKSITIEEETIQPILIGFSFYHKGREYVIKAINQEKARAIFYKLIQDKCPMESAE